MGGFINGVQWTILGASRDRRLRVWLSNAQLPLGQAADGVPRVRGNGVGGGVLGHRAVTDDGSL